MRHAFTPFLGSIALGIAALGVNAANSQTYETPVIPPSIELVTIKVDGHQRDFYVHKPNEVRGRRSVIIALHGGRGSADRFMDDVSLIDHSREMGFIAVFPDSFDGNWNDGRAGFEDKPNDVKFMRSIINWLVRHDGVDRSRVFMTGHSNGGVMTHKIACDAPELIAAAAPMAANLSEELHSDCSPSEATPVVMFNGTEDPLMLYEGGQPDIPGEGSAGTMMSSEGTAKFWAGIAGCWRPNAPRVTDLRDRVGDGTTVSILEHRCSDDQVTLYRVEGGGHGIPGGEPAGHRESMIGTTSQEIDAFEEAIDFFSDYGL